MQEKIKNPPKNLERERGNLFFGILDCSYITFMIVPINKNIITKYITHY